jgi:hypothetical protein
VRKFISAGSWAKRASGTGTESKKVSRDANLWMIPKLRRNRPSPRVCSDDWKKENGNWKIETGE